uniref:Uncharacterized protein n=1 Tax=Cucumis melo TaxID=3656 RepID=A0A9I9EBK1_CUCME
MSYRTTLRQCVGILSGMRVKWFEAPIKVIKGLRLLTLVQWAIKSCEWFETISTTSDEYSAYQGCSSNVRVASPTLGSAPLSLLVCIIAVVSGRSVRCRQSLPPLSLCHDLLVGVWNGVVIALHVFGNNGEFRSVSAWFDFCLNPRMFMLICTRKLQKRRKLKKMMTMEMVRIRKWMRVFHKTKRRKILDIFQRCIQRRDMSRNLPMHPDASFCASRDPLLTHFARLLSRHVLIGSMNKLPWKINDGRSLSFWHINWLHPIPLASRFLDSLPYLIRKTDQLEMLGVKRSMIETSNLEDLSVIGRSSNGTP